jgi:hypothetical protein
MIETILISVMALAWVPAVVLGARYMATGHLCRPRSLPVRAANELLEDAAKCCPVVHPPMLP